MQHGAKNTLPNEVASQLDTKITASHTHNEDPETHARAVQNELDALRRELRRREILENHANPESPPPLPPPLAIPQDSSDIEWARFKNAPPQPIDIQSCASLVKAPDAVSSAAFGADDAFGGAMTQAPGVSSVASSAGASHKSQRPPHVHAEKLLPEAFYVVVCKENESCQVAGGPSAVIRAWYGVSKHVWTETRGADVTDEVKHLLTSSSSVRVCKDSFGDPASGSRKELHLEIKKAVFVLKIKEHESRDVPIFPASVSRAWYGSPGHEWTAKFGNDVTENVKQLLGGSSSVMASNDNFGDPAPRHKKVLCIEVKQTDDLDNDEEDEEEVDDRPVVRL